MSGKKNCLNCKHFFPLTGIDCPEGGDNICLGTKEPYYYFLWEPRELYEADSAHNNGGATDYYDFEPEWKQCQDVVEARKMNFAQGNMFKSTFCFNTDRHSGTNYERELNKIVYYVQRELTRIKKEGGDK